MSTTDVSPLAVLVCELHSPIGEWNEYQIYTVSPSVDRLHNNVKTLLVQGGGGSASLRSLAGRSPDSCNKSDCRGPVRGEEEGEEEEQVRRKAESVQEVEEVVREEAGREKGRYGGGREGGGNTWQRAAASLR